MIDIRLTRAVHGHDHAECTAEALSTAEAVAVARSVKLTPLRKQVLSLICQSHRPVGAYQILSKLSREKADPVAPPTVYRALDFLIAQGLVHKIDSLNAFVACFSAGQPHRGLFLICTDCHDVQEVTHPGAHASLFAASEAMGFDAARAVAELHGRCAKCATV